MNFDHVVHPGSGARTFVALHGTGGDEHQIVPLVQAIDPDATVVGIRGKVVEGSMLRYFRRHAENVFDYEDLLARTHELADWLIPFLGPGKNVSLVGYSNGATMAASLMLWRPELAIAAVLLRPSVPGLPASPPDLAGKSVLSLVGGRDEVVDPLNGARLEDVFVAAGARFENHVLDADHGIGDADVAESAPFLGVWAEADASRSER